MQKNVLFFISLMTCALSQAQTWSTDYAKPDGSGCLTYKVDANQNSIPNFSHAGYKGGGVALPTVAVKKTISAISGDNTAHIQAAIDEVAALPLDGSGFRGAVYLNAGTYEVYGSLLVNASGVVLRGAGDGRGGSDTTLIYGRGNTPNQRDLITLGGGSGDWRDEVSGTRQNITTAFVPVGSYSFDVADASGYTVGDNIIITHPCTSEWLAAINGGGTATDASWTVGSYPIVYNRVITKISGNTLTIDAPVYNHLDLSLSQSYVYIYDKKNVLENIGFENIRVDIETAGGVDEAHIWNAIQLTGLENAWVQNCTMEHFGLSGVIATTSKHISVVNCHALDPVAIVTGERMYNFNCYTYVNNILFDNCVARHGRHHFVSNGTSSVSGFVVLNSTSINPQATSEGHRHWTTGMLFDNLKDYGTYLSGSGVMGFYNRGDYGTGHGWSAAHSVFWNCNSERNGVDGSIIVEQPPTAQNYAIGCKGSVLGSGPFAQSSGYIEGTNNTATLVPNSLYEAQLLCRTAGVIADFTVSKKMAAPMEVIRFSDDSQGNPTSYQWDFGAGASPATATGVGPHDVTYSASGTKTVSLTVSNGSATHTEIKSEFVEISDQSLFAVNDAESITKNTTVTTTFLTNDSWSALGANNCLVFNGSSNKVVYTTTNLLDAYPFTMMAWFKTNATGDQVIVYSGNGFSGITGNSLSIRSGKVVLEAWLYNGSTTKKNITGSTVVNDGQWHHVAGIFTSATQRELYVDGVSEGTDNAALSNIDTQEFNKFSVGNRDDSSPGDWFTGTIDDVKMYCVALTPEEVANAKMGLACGVLSTAAVLDWSFDDSSTLIATDQAGYFDGDITGASYTTSTINHFELSAEIRQKPSHGTASFSGTFAIDYTPDLDYLGVDTVSYVLKSGDCDSSEAYIIYDISSLTGLSAPNHQSLTVFPNPANDVLRVNASLVMRSYQLTAIDGHVVQKGMLNSSTATIGISELAEGMYILEVLGNDSEKVFTKVVVD